MKTKKVHTYILYFLQTQEWPAGRVVFKGKLAILEKEKALQFSRIGKGNFAECCCPWYWNHAAAHPVTTAILVLITLWQLSWCITFYGDHRIIFLDQHITYVYSWNPFVSYIVKLLDGWRAFSEADFNKTTYLWSVSYNSWTSLNSITNAQQFLVYRRKLYASNTNLLNRVAKK